MVGVARNGVSLMWETLTWKRETWEVSACVRQQIALSSMLSVCIDVRDDRW